MAGQDIRGELSAETHEALAKECEGQHETWERVLKPYHKQSFVINTMPDVTAEARILAVCGITDMDDASPDVDGWFFSDFFLFNHLLRGISQDQIWLSGDAISPQAIVDKYVPKVGPSPFLHGNPSKNRKVVLDREILNNNLLTPVTTVEEHKLLETFLAQLKRMSEASKADKSPIIILLFGHGGQEPPEVALGRDVDGQDVFLNIGDLKAATFPTVQVTVMSTAVLSGGWTVLPDINFTMLTAAGAANESESWNQSPTLSRSHGSIYASAVAEALLVEMDPSFKRREDGTMERELDEEGSKAYRDFTKAVFQALNAEVGGFRGPHDIRFEAEDDDWEMKWTKRTGLPLITFERRYASLKDYIPPQFSPEE